MTGTPKQQHVLQSYTQSTHKRRCSHLEVPQLGERVNDDAEDDVEADGGDEDEEGEVVDDQQAKLEERVLRGVVH